MPTDELGNLGLCTFGERVNQIVHVIGKFVKFFDSWSFIGLSSGREQRKNNNVNTNPRT